MRSIGSKSYLLLAMCMGAFVVFMACDNRASKPAVAATNNPAASEAGIEVYFAPETDCAGLIVDLIGKSKKSIWMQAYSFKSERIAKALVDAYRRDVDVRVIIDADKAEKKETNFLAKRGIPTYVDNEHEKAHNKVMLIDGNTIITGSFNFTEEEEAKADNVLVIRDKPQLIGAYEKNFQEHLGHAKKW